jgi:hypothetical protein
MKDPENRKENRKKKWDNNFKQKTEVSEEQKFINKAKKQFKKKIEETRVEETWGEWEYFE